MLPRNLKGISEGSEISEFGIIDYSVRNESGSMTALCNQDYYFTGLPKYLIIIYTQ